MDNPPLAVEEPYDTSWVAAFLAGSALGAVADGFVVAMALYQVFAFRLDAVRPLYRCATWICPTLKSEGLTPATDE
jgi:hypothetical protein